jgi:DNA-binding protein HU-beta
MTKKELIDKVAKEAKITKSAAGKALDGVIGGITGALRKGDKVTLVGFGTFTTARRAARKVRNPQTGEAMRVAAKKVPKFRPGAELKKAVK